MTELLTAAQMRAIEGAAIASGAVTGLGLMEQAGRGVVEAIFDQWAEPWAKRYRVMVLCGPGNNGGDGFVVARLLAEWGWEVEVFLFGDPARLPPDAATNYRKWCALGKVQPLAAAHAAQPADIYVDAVFGTGLTRAPEGELAKVLHAIGPEGGNSDWFADRVVAIDAPSGLCLDSGRVLGAGLCPAARLTIAFDSPKIGHFIGQGPAHCGRVVVKDIGIRHWREHDISEPDQTVLPPFRPALTRLVGARPMVPDRRMGQGLALPDKASEHKFSHGHALIFTGPSGKGGAARLAGRGALRIGAGLVTLACPAPALAENAARLDAVMLTAIPDGDPVDAVRHILSDDRINALCLGPGLGLDRAPALVEAALHRRCATVLDADALTAFADAPYALFDQTHPLCVLTPHAGEFTRLFPDISARLQEPPRSGPAYSKLDATRAAAARAGCTVLFKGPDTVIAAPDGHALVHAAHYDRSAPWLATAGAGDVLAGFITGLLARGMTPMSAAQAAAWLHVECARAIGPGLIAEDLPDMLPKVFRDAKRA